MHRHGDKPAVTVTCTFMAFEGPVTGCAELEREGEVRLFDQSARLQKNIKAAVEYVKHDDSSSESDSETDSTKTPVEYKWRAKTAVFVPSADETGTHEQERERVGNRRVCDSTRRAELIVVLCMMSVLNVTTRP